MELASKLKNVRKRASSERTYDLAQERLVRVDDVAPGAAALVRTAQREAAVLDEVGQRDRHGAGHARDAVDVDAAAHGQRARGEVRRALQVPGLVWFGLVLQRKE